LIVNRWNAGLNDEEELPRISAEGKDLADTLRAVLEEVDFDRLNRELQREVFGGDYSRAPYPVSGLGIDPSTIRERLELCVQGVDPKMTRRQKYSFEFLMLSESLQREELETVFGGERRDRIPDFIDTGLFAETGDGRSRMNGLFLLSKSLMRENTEKIIYILADSMLYDHPEHYRVYLGLDSYELLNKLQDLDEPSGTGIDMGSGSGIQLVGALKLFPEIKRMVGYEKDRKAISVSRFNAYLNSVGDRTSIVENAEELMASLRSSGNQADFAVSNPPFMPVPESLEVEPGDVSILSRAEALHIIGKEERPQIPLRNMWPASGWGGADGLSVLKPMLEVLFPLIRREGKIIVYAEFAGDSAGPSKIVEFVEGLRGWTYEWIPLKPSLYHFGNSWNAAWPCLTAESMAQDVIQHVIIGYRELSQPPYDGILMKYADRILDIYRSLGITHFHKGFLILTKTVETQDR
jgi:hypothetical protein